MLNIFKPKISSSFEQVELESVCRICLNSSSNLLPLFDNEIDSLISEFLPQKLSRNSFQPHQICFNCCEEAKTAYIFKKQCQYSDELIRSMVNEPDISQTCEKQTQTDISNDFIYPYEKWEKKRTDFSNSFMYSYEKCDQKFEESLEILREHRLNRLNKTQNAYQNYTTKDVLNGAIEENSPKFVKIDKYEFSCEHCLENFEVEDGLKNHECTNFLESALEENSSNMLQLINDCYKNEMDVDPFCEDENSACNTLFEDILKTNDGYEENTVEKKKKKAKDIRFDCNICLKSFTRKTNLQRHVDSVHIGLRPFQCTSCKKSFKQEEHLKFHISRVACASDFNKKGEKVFACEICLEKFLKIEYVRDHKAEKHSETKEFSCKYCPEKIIGDIEYKKHCKGHKIKRTKPKAYLCWECGAGFTKPQYLSIHEMRHRNEKPYKCQHCDRGFVTPSELRAHEKSHTGEKIYHCTECSKAFPRAYKLRVHMRIHTGERPYKCSYCSRSFNESNGLKAHERSHTGERFNCDLCGAGFLHPSLLKQHKRKVHCIYVPRAKTSLLDNTEDQNQEEKMLVLSSIKENKTTTEKPKTVPTELFPCSQCESTFTKLQYLNIHLMRHTGEKPHKCGSCDRAFVTSSERNYHERKHGGEKDFLCTECPKAFSRSYALRVHMRTHTGEVPPLAIGSTYRRDPHTQRPRIANPETDLVPLQQLQQQQQQQQTDLVPLQQQQQQRPYKCLYCPKAFTQSTDLAAHHRRHTGERFYCDLCDVSFVQMHVLKQHKRKVHGIDEPRSTTSLLIKKPKDE